MTAVLFILAIAVAVMAFQNRRLSSQIAALCDRQEQTEEKINRLGKASRKQTNTARRQEQKIERLHRRQREQADRQNRLEKEQRKQAADLRKMEFKLAQATADIEAAKIRLSSLYSLLDVAEMNRAAQVPGSPADYRYQKQVTSLQHSISIAERGLSKARFDAEEARQGMAA